MTKIALVTGASSGIGEATVTKLLKAGYKVYAAARRVDRMETLRTAGAQALSLDVTDDASMVAAIEAIRAADGRIDVLVNNAGYGSYGAIEDVPMAEARRQIEVNLFGLARMCQLVLPMMRAQKSGKIVNISSIGGKIWEPFGGWYHATKFAVEGLSDCLRMEVNPFGIDVIVIEPGAIQSEWKDIASETLLKASGETVYAPFARNHAAMFKTTYASKMVSPPETVARTIVHAVQAGRPKTRYATGGGASMILLLRKMLPDRAFDWMMWRTSQRG